MPILKPDTTITRDQLLNTTAFGDYLKLKLDQLAISRLEASGATGYKSVNRIGGVINKDEDAKGFDEGQMDGLLGLFNQKHQELDLPEYDEEEQGHAAKLNDDLPKSTYTGTLIEDDTHLDICLLMDTRHQDYMEENAPSQEMLQALASRDAETWNTLKKQRENKKPIFLVGLQAEQLNLTGFDLSNCDLRFAKWPRDSQYTTPSSLEKSIIYPLDDLPGNELHDEIPMSVRRKHEEDNAKNEQQETDTTTEQTDDKNKTPLQKIYEKELGKLGKDLNWLSSATSVSISALENGLEHGFDNRLQLLNSTRPFNLTVASREDLRKANEELRKARKNARTPT